MGGREGGREGGHYMQELACVAGVNGEGERERGRKMGSGS